MRSTSRESPPEADIARGADCTSQILRIIEPERAEEA
jgi:hypothetical protein